MYALKESVWCNGSKCIKQIVVFGPFYCLYLLWNETKPFSGQKLAIFFHFIAHDGSKITPIRDILVPKNSQCLSWLLRCQRVEIICKNEGKSISQIYALKKLVRCNCLLKALNKLLFLGLFIVFIYYEMKKKPFSGQI